MAIAAAIFLIAPAGGTARAADLNDSPALRVGWDNTVILGTIAQPGRAGSAVCPDTASCAYGPGAISGRVDWLSELDVSHGDLGVRVSSSAWYDAIDNSFSAEYGYEDVSELGGHHIELADAFLHDKVELGEDQPLYLRVGRYTLLWGGSQFFPQNGIAAGQAPVDTYAPTADDGYGARTAFLPVGQASVLWQVTPTMALQAFDQFEWRRSRINPEEGYASATDLLGAQGNQRITLETDQGGYVAYTRLPDRAAAMPRQFGIALTGHADDVDYGVYALTYAAKTPVIAYSAPPSATSYGYGYGYGYGFGYAYGYGYGARPAATYRLVYPDNIDMVGLSLNGAIADANLGTEISVRHAMPLVNDGVWDSGSSYPVGNTLHALFSWAESLEPQSLLADGGEWRSEIAVNRLLSVTANASQLVPGRSDNAAALRTVFAPKILASWRRFDITLPIGVGYNFLGRSAVDDTMNRGTGDVTIGINATLDSAWRAAIGFTHYFGRVQNASVITDPTTGGPPLAHWDFVAATVKRTF